MSLSKKTFLYSAIISGAIVTFMIIYFIFMLPSLYVNYIEKDNFQAVKSIHENYISYEDYGHIPLRNPTGAATIKIPKEGNEIYIYNKLGSLRITIKDEEILDFLNLVRDYTRNKEKLENMEEEHMEVLGERLKDLIENSKLKDNKVLSIDPVKNTSEGIYKEVSSKVDIISDNTVIYESNSTDGNNYYTNYAAVTLDNQEIIMTILPVMTPKIGEIKPIILESMPMIMVVSLLLIIVSTAVFSRKIVNPIENLVNQAVFIKDNVHRAIEPMKVEDKDEIGLLTETLNELYLKLSENMKELEEKNIYLHEQNERQEIFLRASSHQLKTPVAAASLLVDGMINEIGKYKDTKKYLPEVKKQLQNMRNIIDDILSLNINREGIRKEPVDLEKILENILKNQGVFIASRNLNVEKHLCTTIIDTDSNLIYEIIDGILGNAINYTPQGEKIKITLNHSNLVIENYGVTIDESLLPHIFDAFVSGNNTIKGHGLGLYISSYYSKLLGCSIDIKNVDNGVISTLCFND